jgi:2,4-dienoyl-CoA reductase-like NADH-dependent reductase (Old Yellow Enzyme family)
MHSQNQKLGIQLAHACRKASTVAGAGARRERFGYGGGRRVAWGCEGFECGGVGFADPKEMSVEDIRNVQEGFRDAAGGGL